MSYLQLFENFISEEEGATGVEYALLAALLSVAIVGSTSALSGSVQNMYVGAMGAVVAAMTGS